MLRRELRAIRIAINELYEAIENHSEAIHAAEERNRNEPSPANPIQAIVSFDDETKGDTQRESNRQYGVQNSIRWAAWLAFGAASIYAGIAAITYWEIQRSTNAAIEAERPWIGVIQNAVGVEGFRIDMGQPTNDGGKLIIRGGVNLIFRNGGRSPAYIDLAEVGYNIYEHFPSNPESICPLRVDPNTKSLIPGAEATIGCVLNGGIIDKLSAPGQTLYVFGRVEYRDVRTQKSYFMHVCKQFFLKTKGPELCVTYNDAN